MPTCHTPSFPRRFLKKSVACSNFSRLFLACVAITSCTVAQASNAALFRRNTAPPDNTVPVLAVTQEIIQKKTKDNVCWQTLVSDRERAQRQYESQPWIVKYWKPILGGVLGGLVGYKFTANYGPSSQKWIYPTIAAGIGVGALTGPGFVAGAYFAGSGAHHYWPDKLPLTIMLSLIGGILGDGLIKLLFPDSPDPALLAKPQPGQYLPDQQFYIETSCMPTMRVVSTEKPYRVTYSYQGEQRHALMKYYPGDRITLNASGWPVNELPP